MPDGSVVVAGEGIGPAVKAGLGWSFLNNVVGRLGNFLSGIIVVRLLTEAEFGTFAVAMLVLQILLSMNELGVSVAVVRHQGDVAEIAPTVATLSIVSSTLLGAGAFFAAPAAAEALGAPGATWIIRVMAIGVLIDGVVSVPNALITRALQQRKRLVIDTVAFLVGTPFTITLAALGYGAWSLAWGALAGSLITGSLALLWAPARFAPGWDRAVVPGLLRFGIPLAGSSLVLLLLLNVDYIVVGHTVGAAELGIYVLAFNVCSWPISVVTSSIRRVMLAAFARMHEHHEETGREGFARVFGLLLAVTLPICACLAVFAPAVIHVLYGARWGAAAEPLRFLAVLALGRMLVELTYDFLAALGRGSSTLWLHLAWLGALIPAMIIGCRAGGITGAALAHAVVVVVVVVPLVLLQLRSAGIRPAVLMVAAARPLAGTAAVLAIGAAMAGLVSSLYVLFIVGPLAGLAAHVLFVWPLRDEAERLWQM
jgi:PST family polysaccharide transporter